MHVLLSRAQNCQASWIYNIWREKTTLAIKAVDLSCMSRSWLHREYLLNTKIIIKMEGSEDFQPELRMPYLTEICDMCWTSNRRMDKYRFL